MSIEDIIESLNRYIRLERNEQGISVNSHLVLQRIVESNPTFKSYKKYEWIVWLIDNDSKYKIVIVSLTEKVLKDQEEGIDKGINKRLCNSLLEALFRFIRTEDYNQIVNGNYKGGSL